jgi:hypothetical protein
MTQKKNDTYENKIANARKSIDELENNQRKI